MAYYRFFAIFMSIFFQSVAMAEIGYFNSESESGCKLQKYQNGELKEVLENDVDNKALTIKKFKNNSNFISFSHNGGVYVTSADCILSEDTYLYEQDDTFKKSYTLEFNAGFFTVLDNSPVYTNYNEILPSVLSTWSKSKESSYQANSVYTIAAGTNIGRYEFLYLKFRVLNGKKIEPLTLTENGTGNVQVGNLVYSDNFYNFYFGYQKFMHPRFLPSKVSGFVAGYFGLSYLTSSISGTDAVHELSAMSLALIYETGLEYKMTQHFSLLASLGAEYIAPKNMEFTNSGDHKNFKSNLNYTNVYQSIGMRVYF
jgi:hypothetical protein